MTTYYKDSENNVYAYSPIQTPKPGLIQITQEEMEQLTTAPEPDPQYKRFTPLEVLDLFTEPEQLAIVTVTQSSPQVKLWYDRLIAATYVTYEDPRTAAGIQQLEDAGLISPERADTINQALQITE